MTRKIIIVFFSIFAISILITYPLFCAGPKIIEATKTVAGVPVRIQIPASSKELEKTARHAIGRAFVDVTPADTIGIVIDKEIAALKTFGIQNALINSDMEIYCLGVKSGDDMWKAWIPHPTDKKKVFAILRLKDKAIATARTKTISVSVVADTAGDAERLAMELLSQGSDGLKTAEKLKLDALFITQDGNSLKTGMAGGFKEQYGKAKK